MLPNSLELLVVYYAGIACGAVVVPVNQRLTEPEVDGIVASAQPQLVITTPKLTGLWHGERARGVRVRALERIDRWLDTGHGASDGGSALTRAPSEDDPMTMVFYTSGSTGKPKGVVYTVSTIEHSARQYRERFMLTADDSAVLCHCMSHNFLFSQLTAPFLQAGGSVRIVDFGSVPQTLAAIREGGTFMLLIPWFGFQLIDALRKRPMRGHELRIALVGGDRVPTRYFTEFQHAFGIMAAEMIGMTETNGYASNPLVEGDLRIGSVGTTFPSVEIEIRSSGGRVLSDGETGRVWVRSPAAMAGYWNDREQIADVIPDGWVDTGDLGRLDSDGYLWFEGRAKDVIVCDGDNIYPAQVERAVLGHAKVGLARAIGVPHPTRGQTVGLAIVPTTAADPPSLEEIVAHVASRIHGGMIPTHFAVVSTFPKTAAGKIDRAAIVALMTAETG